MNDDEIRDRNIWIYDLETYCNMFLGAFYNIDTKEWKLYEISERRNDTTELRKFLLSGIKLIGFNNVNFDYPVLHNTILSNYRDWDALSIYVQTQSIINAKYSAIWDNRTKVPQLDLFKIWHYDNKNKSASLKWLEFAMRWENVQDLPYSPHSTLSLEQMEHIVEYCKNDVKATYQFFLKSLKHIELRQFYTNHEGMNLMNASEIKMSKEIFGKYLATEMGMSVRDVKQLRTNRPTVMLKDIIFPYLKFNDPINQQTLEKYKSYRWIDTSDMSKEEAKKHAVKFSTPYKNVIREYAEGGLHSFGKAGIYESDDEYVLVDVDFASFYPHISFRNKLHPAHIPEEVFNQIYEGFYEERKKYPKSDPRNYVLKIILNGSYGLSKDKHAFLYDPKWQLEICINGQLILTLLTEKVFDVIPDAQIIFENTDGAMYRIRRSMMPALETACKEVEKIVNIPLETQVCQKIIARDVNNYINIIDNGTVKFKGAFEINRDFHKNHSKRIVPLALANYYLNDVAVEETILNHLNVKEYKIPMDKKANANVELDKDYYQNYGIFDFCLGAKMKGGNKLYATQHTIYGTVENELGKVTRYYVSNEGVELIKKLPPNEKSYLTATDKHKIKFGEGQVNIFDFIDDVKVDPDDRAGNIEAGHVCRVFNIYEKEKYDINYDYYINECNKIITQF